MRRLRLSLAEYGGMHRDVKLLIWSGLLGGLPWGYIMVIQSIYLKSIGLDEATIGLIYSVSGVAGPVSIIPFGILSDRYGRKPFIVVGGLVTAVFPLLYATTTDPSLLLLAGVLSSIGGAMSSPPWGAMLADKSTDENRTAVFSLSWFAWTAASTIGALFSGVPDSLMEDVGFDVVSAYRPLFLAGAILFLLSSIIVLPIQESWTRIGTSNLFPRKSARTIARFAIVIGLVGGGAGFIIPFFSLWFFLRFDVGGGLIGPLFSIANGVMAVSYLLAPKLARTAGTVNSVVVMQLASTAVLLMVPAASSYGAAAILYVVRNFMMNMSGPIQSSYMMTMVTPDERASTSSIVSMPFGVAWAVPNALSQVPGGYMLKQKWLSLPFYICGSLYVASAVAFYVFFRKSKPPQERT